MKLLHEIEVPPHGRDLARLLKERYRESPKEITELFMKIVEVFKDQLEDMRDEGFSGSMIMLSAISALGMERLIYMLKGDHDARD